MPEDDFAQALGFFTSSVKHALAAVDSRLDHIEEALARMSPSYVPWKLPEELRAEIEAALEQVRE